MILKEADTTAATSSEEVIVRAREWLLDMKDPDDADYEAHVELVLGETDAQTRKRVSRRYRGGWFAFVREHGGQHRQ